MTTEARVPSLFLRPGGGESNAAFRRLGELSEAADFIEQHLDGAVVIREVRSSACALQTCCILKHVHTDPFHQVRIQRHPLSAYHDVIATIELTAASEGEKTHRFVDLLGRVAPTKANQDKQARGWQRPEYASLRRALGVI